MITTTARANQKTNARLERLEFEAQKASGAGKGKKAIKNYLELAHRAYPAGHLDKSLEAYDKAISMALERGQVDRAARIMMEKAEKLEVNARTYDAIEEYGNTISAARSAHLVEVEKEATEFRDILCRSFGRGRTAMTRRKAEA
ncbi:MAG: hypothetical protein V1728_02915 [Candidatus Micrarchaeota archaeon]